MENEYYKAKRGLFIVFIILFAAAIGLSQVDSQVWIPTLILSYVPLLILLSKIFIVNSIWPILVYLTNILYISVQALVIGITSAYSTDEEMYHALATTVSEGFLPSFTYYGGTLGEAVTIYVNFSGAFYYVFEQNRLLMPIINSAIYSISTILFVKICHNIYSERSDLVGAFFVMYPAGTLTTATHLRESIALFFVAIILLQLSSEKESLGINNSAIILAGMVILLLLRTELFLGLFSAMILVLIYRESQKVVARLSISTLILSILWYLLNLPLPDRIFQISIQEFNRQRKVRQVVEGVYLEDLTYTSIFDIIISLPANIFYFFLYPFPWDINIYFNYLFGRQSTTNFLFAIVDTTFILLFSVMLLISISQKGSFTNMSFSNKKTILIMIVYCIIVMVGLSLIVSTITNMRRRFHLIPIFLVICTPFISKYISNIHVRY